MKVLQIYSFMVALGCMLLFAACDMGTIQPVTAGGDTNMEKDNQEKIRQEERRCDIFFGKVGQEAAIDDFAGAKFVAEGQESGNNYSYLLFDTNTNSCQVRPNKTKSAIGSYDTAVYTIKNNRIILDLSAYSTLMSTMTIDDFERYIQYKYKELLQNSSEARDDLKKTKASLKKHKCFEYTNKIYKEYLKNKPLEGVISEDKNTITIQKFICPDYDTIIEYKNVVFKREKE